jgi:hypothetical protein
MHISVLFFQTAGWWLHCVAETCSYCVQYSVWTGYAVLYWGRSGKQLLDTSALWLLKISYQSIEEGNLTSNDHNISRKNFRYDVCVMQIRLCVVTVALSADLAVSSPELRIPPPPPCHMPNSFSFAYNINIRDHTNLLRHTPSDSPVLQTDPASVVSRYGGSCDISVSATRGTVTSLHAAAIIDVCNVRTVCFPLACCSPAERRCNRVQRYLTIASYCNFETD